MKVLMMIQTLWQGGGTETHVMTLASGLRSMGHHVAICTSGGAWVARARNNGLQVLVHPGIVRQNPQSIATLSRFIRTHQFDVIHAHDSVSLIAAANALRGWIRKPALIFTVHGPYVGPRALRLARYSARAVIAVSAQIRLHVLRTGGLPTPMVHTIANGIRTDIFRPARTGLLRQRHGVPTDAFVIGYAGRFTFDKAVLGRRICQTLRRYAASHPRVHVMIAGRNSRNVIPGSPRVHVLGHVPSMETFYNSCNLMIGTARVAEESLACGVPTLVIGIGGYHGLVNPRNLDRMVASNFGDHGRTGRQWTSATLARALDAIRQKQGFHQQETRLARARVIERLAAQRMVQRVLMLYRSLT